MSPEQLLDALARLPGGPQLLRASEDRDDVSLVGGAVRDLLLDRAPRELDVVLDGDVGALAASLARELDASLQAHERFGTALLEWPDGRIDLAARRAETYAAPGALPDVRPGGREQDLRRRDFTVNAIAIALGGARQGRLEAAEHALEDLAAARLRVLHEHSFSEDPTRLLRLARYRARLGFVLEERTAELAAAALAAGALHTVSRARIGAELRLALAESDAVGALAQMDELGLLAAVDPLLSFDRELADAALALLALGAREEDPRRPDLLALATLLCVPADGDPDGERGRAVAGLLDALEFTAAERDLATQAATQAHALAARLARVRLASQISRAAAPASPEAVALAGALARRRGLSAAAEAASRWLRDLRGVRLAIGGADLLAAGVPEGPQIGARLQAALARKLDGTLDGDGRDAELRAALEAST